MFFVGAKKIVKNSGSKIIAQQPQKETATAVSSLIPADSSVIPAQAGTQYFKDSCLRRNGTVAVEGVSK